MASACVYIECPVTKMILGVSRKDDPNAFGLPGGKVDGEEPEIHAARRELHEETGLWVPYFWFNEVFRREGGVTYQIAFARVDWGDVDEPLASETGRVAWVTPAQLIAGPFGDYNRRLLVAIGRNQCDGCRAGKVVEPNTNYHVMGSKELDGYRDLMACQAGRY